MSISQRKTRTSAVALLTVAGGLVAAVPVLITADEATAAERKIVGPGNKGPSTPQGLRPRGERGIVIWMRNKTKGERGTAPYTWSSGTLPPGLTLSPTGVLSGTPAFGSYLFTVAVPR